VVGLGLVVVRGPGGLLVAGESAVRPATATMPVAPAMPVAAAMTVAGSAARQTAPTAVPLAALVATVWLLAGCRRPQKPSVVPRKCVVLGRRARRSSGPRRRRGSASSGSTRAAFVPRPNRLQHGLRRTSVPRRVDV